MNEIKALLHNRNYVLYWLASMCSEFGSITLQFVISLYVFDLTGNSVLYGTLLFIAIVPRLVFYPLAGMLADRYDRRLLLLVPTGCAAIVLFAFTAIELFVMPLGVASLFVLVILLEVFNIFFMSANLSVPPMIVSRQQLGAANSMGILYSDFGYVIGMVVGALVYGLLGFTWSLLAISLCFALGFVFIIPLRLVQASNAAAQGARAGRAEAAALGDASTGEKSVGPRAAREPQVPAGAREPQVPAGAREPQVPATPARPTAPARQLAPARPAATSAFDPDQLVAASSLRGFLAEITLGVRVVLKDRTLLIIFIVSTAFNFFCVPIWDVVLLFFARGDLGLGPIGYGVFSSVQAIGDLVIAFVAAQYYTDARALRFLRICPVAFVAALAIMLVSGFIAGHAPLPVVLVVAAFGSAVLAMMATIFIISRNTIIQKRVREDNLARVFSVSRMTALVALPLGNLAFGFLVAHSGYLGSLTVSIVATALLITVTLGLRVGHRRAGDAAPL